MDLYGDCYKAEPLSSTAAVVVAAAAAAAAAAPPKPPWRTTEVNVVADASDDARSPNRPAAATAAATVEPPAPPPVAQEEEEEEKEEAAAALKADDALRAEVATRADGEESAVAARGETEVIDAPLAAPDAAPGEAVAPEEEEEGNPLGASLSLPTPVAAVEEGAPEGGEAATAAEREGEVARRGSSAARSDRSSPSEDEDDYYEERQGASPCVSFGDELLEKTKHRKHESSMMMLNPMVRTKTTLLGADFVRKAPRFGSTSVMDRSSSMASTSSSIVFYEPLVKVATAQEESLEQLAKRAKKQAEAGLPKSLLKQFDQGIDLVLELSSEDSFCDGDLSEREAQEILLELSLRNPDVASAVRAADSERIVAIGRDLVATNLEEERLTGRLNAVASRSRTVNKIKDKFLGVLGRSRAAAAAATRSSMGRPPGPVHQQSNLVNVELHAPTEAKVPQGTPTLSTANGKKMQHRMSDDDDDDEAKKQDNDPTATPAAGEAGPEVATRRTASVLLSLRHGSAAAAPPLGLVAKRIRFAPVVHCWLFDYTCGASVPSDGGCALGFAPMATAELECDLEEYEKFRGGRTADEEDAAFAKASAKAAMRALAGKGDDDSGDDDSSDSEPREDWVEDWRVPREYFLEHGRMPIQDREACLGRAGHRRLSIDLNRAQLSLISQSRKKNSKSKAATLLMEGRDPNAVEELLVEMEACARVAPFLYKLRDTARTKKQQRQRERKLQLARDRQFQREKN